MPGNAVLDANFALYENYPPQGNMLLLHSARGLFFCQCCLMPRCFIFQQFQNKT